MKQRKRRAELRLALDQNEDFDTLVCKSCYGHVGFVVGIIPPASEER